MSTSIDIKTMMENNRHTCLLTVAIICLIFLGLIYTINGIWFFLQSDGAGDLALRWRERAYLTQGINPYDVSVQYSGVQPSSTEAARIAQRVLSNEPPILSGYPPWGLAATFVLIPPGPLDLVKVFFTFLSLLALGGTVYFCFKLGHRWGLAGGLLLASAAFAMFGNASTLRLGQYSLILNYCLFLGYLLQTKNHKLLSGFAFAMSAIKPNFSLLSLSIMIPRCELKATTTIAVVVIFLSTVPWFLTGVAPTEMIKQMMIQSAEMTQGDTSLIGTLRNYFSYSMVSTSLGIFSLTSTLLIGWTLRNSSLLVSLSYASIIGRLFFYHRQYDNIMLLFPLITLGAMALVTDKKLYWWAFLIFGITLWMPIPYKAYSYSPTIALLSFVWLSGAVIICRGHRSVPRLSK